MPTGPPCPVARIAGCAPHAPGWTIPPLELELLEPPDPLAVPPASRPVRSPHAASASKQPHNSRSARCRIALDVAWPSPHLTVSHASPRPRAGRGVLTRPD